jgi:C1A family cysteine protease
MRTKKQFAFTWNNRLMHTLSVAAILLLFSFTSCKKEVPVEPLPTEQQSNQQDPLLKSAPSFETGVLLLSPEEYAKIPMAETPLDSLNDAPAIFTLSTPPVGNQGSEGSCVAFGCAYAARSIMWRKNHPATGYFNNLNIFSPEFVYNQIKVSSDCRSGSYVTSALDLMKRQGVCRWSVMPYTPDNCSKFPNIIQYWDASRCKISGYARVMRIVLLIKVELWLGRPVIVAGPVDENYLALGPGGVLRSRQGFIGNHCYSIVGYDDSKKAFKIMNSWGTNWGSSGYGWISYNNIQDWFTELYRLNN